MYAERLNKLHKLMESYSLDYYLETNQSNIFYLTGFNCSARMLIKKNCSYIFLSKMLENQFLNLKQKNIKLIILEKSFTDTLIKTISRLKIKKIGANFKALDSYTYLQLKNSVNFKDSGALVESLRAVKDKKEISKIRKACRITHSIYKNLEKTYSKSDTELDFKYKINKQILDNKIDNAFDTIVCFGKNSAYPHHIATNIKKKETELCLVDFGVKYKGYSSDLTRILFLDKIKKRELIDIYNIVADIKEELFRYIKPGIMLADLDLKARRVAKKYKSDYLHSTGHGVGLDIHEGPTVSLMSCEVLKENMVITIEPGIYIKGLGGIRLEDTVLVTKKGYEVLTK